MQRLRREIMAKLPFLTASMALWLMLSSIMGASASYFDSEQSTVGVSGFTSSRWMQTAYSDFLLDVRSNVDIIRQPGDVLLSGRTEYLYAFQGGNSRGFWRYDTSNSTIVHWTALANAPVPLKDEGGSLASDNDHYIYAIHGGTRQFWRYDAVSNSWTILARTPENVKLGGGLCYDGSDGFYALQGDSKDGFWRYSVLSNSWTVLANTPGSVNDGGCLVRGSRDCLFALQGGGLSTFWRYNLTSNTWTDMASIPYPVRYGGAMACDGVDSIFALPGWSQAHFLRYSISENHWYVMPSIPTPVSYGGSIAFSYPGLLYAFSGGSTARYWQYNVAAGLWHIAESIPGNVGAGGALASGPTLFQTTGVLQSVTFDTGKVDATVQGIYWTEALMPGTDIIFEMRASNNLVLGEPSSAWISLGGTSPITSGMPSGKYMQWRATLITTEVHSSPALQEVRVYYA